MPLRANNFVGYLVCIGSQVCLMLYGTMPNLVIVADAAFGIRCHQA